jgi:hypothetical protein
MVRFSNMKDPTIADVLTAVAGFAAHVTEELAGVGKRLDSVGEDIRQMRDDMRGLRYDLMGERDEHVKLKRRVERLEERAFGSVQH